MTNRCAWVGDSQLEQAYHDQEWGVPAHDDPLLFEFLILEGAQAGLSWLTILNKREGYRLAFDHFNAHEIAEYDDQKRQQLMHKPEIVRNRLKINAAITNASAFLEIQTKYGSFDNYIWQFTNHRIIQNHWAALAEIPASNARSEAMSKDLKRRGFKFVGPTICYAFMQATGMVNDHTVDCFRHNQLYERGASAQDSRNI
jgi:DNA-3-methyladenine glycosylase I